ncbi:MAG: hypothetical protein IJO72_04330 [Oscillospiraceae bacterium]|nr:hypothetical protein [Oscillospiraceae bacterium]
MKQYFRYTMDLDGKWMKSSLLCMAGALVTLLLYYFGLRGLISVGFLEAVFCLFLPLILMAAYIVLIRFKRINAPGLYAIIGLLLCVLLFFGIFGSGSILRIILGAVWYPLMALILVGSAGGYLPGKQPAVLAFPVAMVFRIVINLGKTGLFGWVYEISSVLTLAALACLIMSFEAKKLRK